MTTEVQVAVPVYDIDGLTAELEAAGYGAEVPCGVYDGATHLTFDRVLTEPEETQVHEIVSKRAVVDARAWAHAQRKIQRAEAETWGFMIEGADQQMHRVKSDRDSILRISQGSTAAIVNPDFFTYWECEDDYMLPCDVDGMKALQLTLTGHGAACFARSQELKALINGATTVPQLEAIMAVDIPAGWPSDPEEV